MTKKMHETEFLDRVRATLEQSIDTIDTETRRRLNRARKRALSSGQRRRFDLRPAFRLSFAALSAAALIVVFTTWYQRPAVDHTFISGIEDVDILANTDHPEFFTEIEFYLWLAEEMENKG